MIVIPDLLNAGLDTPTQTGCMRQPCSSVVVVFTFLPFSFFYFQCAGSLKMMTGIAAGPNSSMYFDNH